MAKQSVRAILRKSPSTRRKSSPLKLAQLAQHELAQMTQLPRVVREELKARPVPQWRKSLTEIAAASFSDAFSAMSAVVVLRNPGSYRFVDHYLRAMRAELEDRDRSWKRQTTRGSKGVQS